MGIKKYRCEEGYAMDGHEYMHHLEKCETCWQSPCKRAEEYANKHGWSYEVKVLRHTGEA